LYRKKKSSRAAINSLAPQAELAERRNRSPFPAFTHTLVKVAIVARLAAFVQGMAVPPAAGGDDAAQEGANNAVARLRLPLGGRYVFGCHGNLLEVG
jgi:hypothetical protein